MFTVFFLKGSTGTFAAQTVCDNWWEGENKRQIRIRLNLGIKNSLTNNQEQRQIHRKDLVTIYKHIHIKSFKVKCRYELFAVSKNIWSN